ncbi:MAG: hypothetical protein FWF45_02825 [Coriobacteriia bacterium]|nr:hypothetical protein [Coriobacteriia bacterium]
MRIIARKILSLLLSGAMICALMAGAPLSAYAASEETTGTASTKAADPAGGKGSSATTTGTPALKSLLAPISTLPGDVCLIGGTGYTSLDDALNAIIDSTPTTIKLLTNINVDDQVTIVDRNVTFDLNGFNLVISNTTNASGGDGLHLEQNSSVDYMNPGSFTVSSEYGQALSVDGGSCKVTGVSLDADGSTAVDVYNNAVVTVSGNIMVSSADNIAVYSHSGSKVTVDGNISATGDSSVGVVAEDGSTVAVNGKITTDGDGVDTFDSGTSVTVVGSIKSVNGYGIWAGDSSTVKVTGNVDGRYCGAYAYDGATVIVKGNITSADGVGVDAEDSGTTVTVIGDISIAGVHCDAIYNDGSIVKAMGNLIATGQSGWGVEAFGGSTTTVNGNIKTSDGAGVFASDGGTVVTVNGMVDAAFASDEAYTYGGVDAESGAAITINGNVKVATNGLSSSSTNFAYAGAAAVDGGTVKINGLFSADPYIALVNANGIVTYLAPADFTTPTTLKGFKTYTNAVSTVWVLSPIAPAITGPQALTVTVGYKALSVGPFTVTGAPVPTVTKVSGNTKITWNAATGMLDIAAGLAPGTYPVTLKASNGISPDATITFVLTVKAAPKKKVATPLGLPATGDSATGLWIGAVAILSMGVLALADARRLRTLEVE